MRDWRLDDPQTHQNQCRCRLILIVMMLAWSLWSTPSQAQSEVHWGGVSLLDFDDANRLYPYTAKLFCQSGIICDGPSLDTMALERVMVARFDHFAVSNELITNAIEGLILTPMISRETVNVVVDLDPNASAYVHVFRVFVTLTLFEFGSGKFIAASPIVIQYTETRDQPMSEEETFDTFRSLYFNNTLGINVFDTLFDNAASMIPHNPSNKYIRVSGIEVSDKVEIAYPGYFSSDEWKLQTIRVLESLLVSRTDSPIIPFIGGDSNLDYLAATFVNASRKIRLPDSAAFNISMTLRDLRRVEQLNERQLTLCHAVAITFAIDGLLGEVFREDFARTIDACGLLKANSRPEPLYQFDLSILTLLDNVTRQFSGEPEEQFLRQNTSDYRISRQKIESATKAVFGS